MSTFTDIVLSRLGSVEEAEIPSVVSAAEDLERKGWTPGEAISYLRWCEHVDPTITEDVALRHMRIVRERVELRLAAK